MQNQAKSRKSTGTLARAGWAALALGAAFSLYSALNGKGAEAKAAAKPYSQAERTMILGSARAGERIVAVGDHGMVLLSDDGGRSFRPARSVPVQSMLNSVHFVDARQGWAVGHGGSILHSEDGGETWSLQRRDTTVDQPLFSVYFKTARKGWATGLWSLLLATEDGGQTWHKVVPGQAGGGAHADKNLYGVFGDRRGNIYIAAEQGQVLKSADDGTTWTALDTGYKGSFWSGLALDDGAILVAGLRGTIYRSDDAGASWSQVPNPRFSSITGLVADGAKVYASALDGVVLASRDAARSFSSAQIPERTALTAVTLNAAGSPVFFSKRGVAREVALP